MNRINYARRLRHHRNSLLNVLEEKDISIMAEIGIFKSKLTKHLLESKPGKSKIKEYYAIDQWRIFSEEQKNAVWNPEKWLKMKTDDWDSFYKYSCELMLWGFRGKLFSIRLPSCKAAQIFPDSYFDFVYIDAHHSYQDVQNDIKAWLPKVKKGKFIGGHDYYSTREHGEQVVKAVDDFFGIDRIELPGGEVWLVQV